MHSSRMRTARLLTVCRSIRWAVCPIPLLDADPPGCRLPLDADPPDAEPPRSRPPPSYVTCDACWEANPPPLDRRNNRRL